MLYRCILGGLWATLFVCQSAHASKAAVYTQLDSFSYSAPLPIYEIAKDWQGDFQGGHAAFTYNRFETGFAWGHWRIGYVARYDYRLHFSEDAARLYYQQKNHINPPSDQLYNIAIDVYHQQSQGLALHYDWNPSPHLSIAPCFTLLNATALLDGDLAGQGHYFQDGSYSAHLRTDYHYTDDVLFHRQLQGQYHATGFGLDFKLGWRPARNLKISIVTYDLLTRLYWHNSPETRAVAHLKPEKTADPFIYYKTGAVEGREFYSNYVQTPPTRVETALNYRSGAKSWSLTEYHDSAQDFLFAGFTYHFPAIAVSASADPIHRALGLDLKTGYLSFGLVSDSTNYKKARLLKFNLGLRVPLG